MDKSKAFNKELRKYVKFFRQRAYYASRGEEVFWRGLQSFKERTFATRKSRFNRLLGNGREWTNK